MIIVIKDIENHFNCDTETAAKISKLLMKATDVSMLVEDIVDFSFCGVSYSLMRTATDWVMIRAVTVRSGNIDDVLQ